MATRVVDLELVNWQTSFTNDVAEDKSAIVGRIGEPGYQSVLASAQSKDELLTESYREWQETIHSVRGAAEELPDPGPALVALKQARTRLIAKVKNAEVRDRLRAKLDEELSEISGAAEVFTKTRSHYGRMYGDPDEAAGRVEGFPDPSVGDVAAVAGGLRNFWSFWDDVEPRIREVKWAFPGADPAEIAMRQSTLTRNFAALTKDRFGALAAAAQTPEDPIAGVLGPILKISTKKDRETILANREEFERLASARSAYLTLAIGLDDLARSMRDAGYGDFLESRRIAAEELGKIWNDLSVMHNRAPRLTVDWLSLPLKPRLGKDGVSPGQIMRQALRAAESYTSGLIGLLPEKQEREIRAGVQLAAPPISEPEQRLLIFPTNLQTAVEDLMELGFAGPQFALAHVTVGKKAAAEIAKRGGGRILQAAGRGAATGAGGMAISPAPETAKERLIGIAGGAVVGGVLEPLAAKVGRLGRPKKVRGIAEERAIRGATLAREATPEAVFGDVAKPTAQLGKPSVLESGQRLGEEIAGQAKVAQKAMERSTKNLDPMEKVSLKELNEALNPRSSVETPPPKGVSVPGLPDIMGQTIREQIAAGEVTSAVKNMARRSPRTTRVMTRQTSMKIAAIAKRVPRAKRKKFGQDLTFYIEGTKNPYIEGDTAAAVKGRIEAIPGGKQIAAQYRTVVEESRQLLNDYATVNLHTEEQFINFVRDYVFRQFLVPPKKDVNAAIAKWIARKKEMGEFLKEKGIPPGVIKPKARVPSKIQRRIPTMVEAIEEFGLMPRTTDAFQSARLWAELNWRGVAAREFVKNLRGMKTREGQPLVSPVLADDYVLVRNNLIEKGGAYVHKDIKRAVEMVLDRPLSGSVGKSIETVNAYVKFANVIVPFFHWGELYFSAAASIEGPGATQTGRIAGPLARGLGRVISPPPLRPLVVIGARSPVTGKRKLLQFPLVEGRKVLKDMDLLKSIDAAGAQVREHRPDVGIGMVERHLENLAAWLDGKKVDAKNLGLMTRPAQTGIEITKRVTSGIPRGVIRANNAALWEYSHNTWKAYAFAQMRQRMLATAAERELAGKPWLDHKTKLPMTIEQVEDDIANVMNSAFGGTEWETQFWANPQAQKFLRRGTFALDWTTANLQIAGTPFAKSPVKAQIGRKYWIDMAITLPAIGGAFQYAIYKASGGDELNKKGGNHKPGIWQNDPTRWAYVDITPYLHSRGLWEPGERRIYIGPGKQVREVARWFWDFPEGMLLEGAAKSSPVIRTVFEQMTGLSTGGWQLDLGDGIFTVERLKHLLGQPIPFGFRENSFYATVSKKKGASKTELVTRMRDAFLAYADPGKVRVERLNRNFNVPEPVVRLFGKESTQEDLRGTIKVLVEAADLNGYSGEEIERMLRSALYSGWVIPGRLTEPSAQNVLAGEFYDVWKGSARTEDGKFKHERDMKKLIEVTEKVERLNLALPKALEGEVSDEVAEQLAEYKRQLEAARK